MNRIIPRSVLTLAAFALAAALQAAVPSAEKLLPDDTLAVVSVPDTAKLRSISEQSPLAQLWNDPAMKPIHDKFMGKLRAELITPLERDLGVKFDDYLALAQGQMSFAITANGWDGSGDKEPAMLFVLDARDKQPALVKALAEFRKKWNEAGKSLRTEKVRDVEFLVVTLTTNDIPATLKRLLPGPEAEEEGEGAMADKPAGKKAEKKRELFIGRVDSLFIAGNALKPIERLVGQLAGASAPVLADVAQFQSCQPEFFRDAHCFGWLNAKVLVEALAKATAHEQKPTEEKPGEEKPGEEESNPFAAIEPVKILNVAGLSGLRNLAFAYQDSPDGPLVQFHLGAPEAERKGLLKILLGEPKETTPPPFVPTDAVKFFRYRLDGKKTWESLTASVKDISPKLMETVDYLIKTADEAGKQSDEKFDLRRQLIDNLGDDIITFEKKPRGNDPEKLAAPPTLTLIGSKKPEEMVAALKVVFGALSQEPKPAVEREFLGHKIYTVTTLAGPQLDADAPKARKQHFSYANGYVLMATDEAILEDYLRTSETQPKALRDAPGLAEAIAKVTGPGTSLFGYENDLESQRANFELLRQVASGADTNAPAGGLNPLPESLGLDLSEEGVKEWFDFALLPPFDPIAKYFHFSVYGVGANVDGVTLKMFMPTPPALKKK
jgi:hypothetical protein